MNVFFIFRWVGQLIRNDTTEFLHLIYDLITVFEDGLVFFSALIDFISEDDTIYLVNDTIQSTSSNESRQLTNLKKIMIVNNYTGSYFEFTCQ